jgi:RimJ/RimL family protein N-acetyltransferase
VILTTNRLRVRTWRDSDREPFHETCSDVDVMRFVGGGKPWSRDRSDEFIARNHTRFAQLGLCQWAVEIRKTGQLAGYCGFVPKGEWTEMGWRLARRCHGRGLGTEAAASVLNYGIYQLQLSRVFLTVQAGNRASLRVAEKIGFVAGPVFIRHGRATIRCELPSRMSTQGTGHQCDRVQ